MRRLILLTLLTAFAATAQNRIVSTSPAITETLYALGAGDRVVGISEYCHYPPEVASKPRIGSYLRPNVEAIVRLRPDLVILEQLPNTALQQLQSSGLRVNKVISGDVNANLRMMQEIADAAGLSAQGRKLTEQIRRQLDQIAASSKGKPTKTVTFLVGRTPGRLEGMVAVGKGSYLNELIAMAGGRNLFATSAMAYAKVSLEAVVRLQPDVIIDMGDMAETVGITDKHKQAVVALWKSRKDVRARVYAVANDIFVVPGPRMVDAAREFQRLIQGSPAP
jgi:iron complex transport system substrate-binding protein